MSRVAIYDSVKSVLNSNTAYHLAKVLDGISERSLNKYKNGDTKIEKMSFGNAIKLTEIYGELAESYLDESLEMFLDELPNLIKKGDVGMEIIKSQIKMFIEASAAKQTTLHNKSEDDYQKTL